MALITRRKWMSICGSTALMGLVDPFVYPASAEQVSIQRHGSAKRGFYSNAFLLEGERECILIDAHLNSDEAKELTALVQATGKPLRAIVITHPHPDHFLGLEHIALLHPQTAIYSSLKALEIIKITVADWPGFSNQLIALKDGQFPLAGYELECLLLPDAESIAPVVLFEHESKTLIAGDHVLSGQHLWLVEARGEAWRRNLDQILNRWTIDRVLPGHGTIGSSELITRTDAYLFNFLALHDKKVSADFARMSMLNSYPDHVFTEALDNSILAYF